MDRRLTQIIGPHLPPARSLPNDPVRVERWHVAALRETAPGMPGDMAARFTRMADELEHHANRLGARWYRLFRVHL